MSIVNAKKARALTYTVLILLIAIGMAVLASFGFAEYSTTNQKGCEASGMVWSGKGCGIQ